MKTKEELTTLKEEVETLRGKLAELTKEELSEVSGGWNYKDIEIYLSKRENGEGEKKGYNVAVFPGLSGFP